MLREQFQAKFKDKILLACDPTGSDLLVAQTPRQGCKSLARSRKTSNENRPSKFQTKTARPGLVKFQTETARSSKISDGPARP